MNFFIRPRRIIKSTVREFQSFSRFDDKNNPISAVIGKRNFFFQTVV